MVVGEELLEAFESHRDILFGYTLALTRDIEIAEEVFQGAGLAIVEEARKGAEVVRFLDWAREVIRRRVAEHFRQRTRVRRKERPLDGLVDRAFAEFEPSVDDGDARRAALVECLRGLSGRKRELIEARYGQGKSIREIARDLSWTEGAVKVALWKARRALFERVRALTEEAAVRPGSGCRAGRTGSGFP